MVEKFDGVEDKERRAQVNKMYQYYDYQKSKNIDNLINNYDVSMKEKAKEFLNNTYMTVTVEKKYSIDTLHKEDNNYWYFKTGVKVAKKDYNGITAKSYNQQNLELMQREIADAQVIIKTTGYRLKLSNGMIYKQLTTNGVVDKNLKNGEIIKDIKDIRDDIYIESISDKLMYGSQLDIEYTIILKNISSVPISNIKLINYLTDFSNDNDGPILDFSEDMQMITTPYTNSQYGWKKCLKEELINNVSECTFKNMKNEYYITLNTENSELLRSATIGANGERYIKLLLTKKLSSDTKDDNTDFADTAEILSYSNDMGIRMKKVSVVNDITKSLTIMPGNSIEGNERKINNSIIKEDDYAESIRIILIPPTGKTIDIIFSIIILMEGSMFIILKELRKR